MKENFKTIYSGFDMKQLTADRKNMSDGDLIEEFQTASKRRQDYLFAVAMKKVEHLLIQRQTFGDKYYKYSDELFGEFAVEYLRRIGDYNLIGSRGHKLGSNGLNNSTGKKKKKNLTAITHSLLRALHEKFIQKENGFGSVKDVRKQFKTGNTQEYILNFSEIANKNNDSEYSWQNIVENIIKDEYYGSMANDYYESLFILSMADIVKKAYKTYFLNSTKDEVSSIISTRVINQHMPFIIEYMKDHKKEIESDMSGTVNPFDKFDMTLFTEHYLQSVELQQKFLWNTNGFTYSLRDNQKVHPGIYVKFCYFLVLLEELQLGTIDEDSQLIINQIVQVIKQKDEETGHKFYEQIVQTFDRY